MGCKRALATAGVLALLVSAHGAAAAGDRPLMVLHLDNAAHMPAGRLERARTEVERVFRDAGVKVTWADGPLCPVLSSVDDTSPTRELAVILTTVPLRAEDSDRSDGVLGEAVHAVGRAYVYPDRVDRATVNLPVDQDRALGRVMAHEIGHLLLTRGHSAFGLMSPWMDFDQIVPCGFSVRESATIRAVLGGRPSTY